LPSGNPDATSHTTRDLGMVTIANGATIQLGGTSNGSEYARWDYVDFIPAAGPFQQDSGADGLVVMEAEDFDANISQGGKSWVSYTATSGFAGAGAMITTPNTGVNNDTGYTTSSPRLDYQVNFTKTGTHYVWVRGLWPTAADNSVHLGLDGAAVDSADRISDETLSATNYAWTNSTRDGVRASITITTLGLHTINVWMREDGTIVDRILLTTNANFTPSGTGPARSPRQAGGGAAALVPRGGFTNPTTSRVDPMIDFDGTGGLPAASLGAGAFGARWTDTVQALVTGTHTFLTSGENRVRLWVNGRSIIDPWNEQTNDFQFEFNEQQLGWENVVAWLARQVVVQEPPSARY
jgi:hypothetical protein